MDFEAECASNFASYMSFEHTQNVWIAYTHPDHVNGAKP